MNDNRVKVVVEHIANNTKTWLELLGYPEYNDTVIGNDIVREIGIDEKNFEIQYKILWSFETHTQAKESLRNWHNEFERFCNDKKNYKFSDCLHDNCRSCNGTGIRKDGLGACVHMMSCPCKKCNPVSM